MGIFSKKTKEEKKITGAHPVQSRARDEVASPSGTAGAATLNGTHRVLIRPHMSEKAGRMEPSGTYVFLVRDEANKTLVKEEVERRYKVKVAKVNIVRSRSETRFFRGRWHEGFIGKKALVTLVPGAKIEMK